MNYRFQEITLQHDELMMVTDRLSLILDAPPDRLSDDRLRKLIDYEIGFLYETLSEHFLFEEMDGYLSEALDKMPSISVQAEFLRNEHAEIRNALLKLKKQSAQMSTSELRQALRELLGKLADHERAEREIMNAISLETPAGSTG
ncbi:MAG: hemerythrin domain-containing protein [Deltaproteobacteria bacterium]|nr:hemerythrin domain-containing protein [Deltaproteobacteria bacterium]